MRSVVARRHGCRRDTVASVLRVLHAPSSRLSGVVPLYSLTEFDIVARAQPFGADLPAEFVPNDSFSTAEIRLVLS